MISTNYQLKQAYKFLNICRDVDPDTEWLKLTKKEIRDYNNRPGSEIVRFSHDWENGWVERIMLPDDIESKEEATEYFMDNYFREYYPTYYDCTGQKFTNWFHVVFLNGRFQVFQRISIDC